jgi:hypothetical protein
MDHGPHHLAVLRQMAINAMQKEGRNAPSEANSNAPLGITNTYSEHWRCLEMRLS